MAEHAQAPVGTGGRRRRVHASDSIELPPSASASALIGAAVSGGWALDAAGVLPGSVCAAAAGVSAAGLLWWTVVRSRAASRGVARAAAVRAERDAAYQALEAVVEAVTRGQAQVRWAVEQAELGNVRSDFAPLVDRPSTGDVCVDAAVVVAQGFEQSWRAVVAAAARRQDQLSARADLAEIFTSISPRLHSLVNRGIAAISDVERDVEDPELMAELFKVDHLLTQIRRAVESLSVLGGTTPPREAAPLVLATVIRRAIAEIPEFARARMAVSEALTAALPGYASPSVVHLLAALLENATAFSSDKVEVHTHRAGSAIAIEVLDRGAGMSQAKREGLNRLLAAPEAEDPRARLREGTLGLLVAALLARRHKITIRLGPNIVGGTQAVVLLPPELLVSADPSNTEQHSTRIPAPASPSGPVRHEPSGPVRENTGQLPRRVRPAPPDPPGSQHRTSAAPSGERRPPLPRRSQADTQHVPPAAQQTAAGHPTSNLMAAFQSRQVSDGTATPPQAAE